MLPRTLYVYYKSIQSYRMSREELSALQSRKLARTIALAYNSSRFYRSKFRARGLAPSDVRSIGEISKVPPLTKREVAENFSDLASAEGLARVTRGSGTTGTAALFGKSVTLEDIRPALQLRHYTMAGVRPWDTMVTLRIPRRYWRSSAEEGEEMAPSTNLDNFAFRIFGRVPPNIRIVQLETGMVAREADQIRRARPDYMMGRASYMRRLAAFMKANGGTVKLRAIFPHGEAVTPTGVKELKDAFGCRVVMGLASSDVGSVCASCPKHEWGHMNEDFTYFEVLKGGEPVGAGETGELVATQFHNDAMPLIRYLTGDLVELGEEGTCDCGSSLKKMTMAKGRVSDFLVTAAGAQVSAMDVADEVESSSGLRDFEVVQASAGEVILRVTQNDSAPDSLDRAKASVQRLLGGRPVFRVEVRDEEEFWGKYRPARSKVRLGLGQ